MQTGPKSFGKPKKVFFRNVITHLTHSECASIAISALAHAKKMRRLGNLRVFHNSGRYSSMFHVNRVVKVPILGTSQQVSAFMNLFLSQEGQSWTCQGFSQQRSNERFHSSLYLSCSFLFLQGVYSDYTTF